MLYSKQIFIVLLISISNRLFAQTNQATVKSPDSTVYTKVDTVAGFPGGKESWNRFLAKTINGATPSDNGAGSGLYRVLIEFLVDKEGNVSNIKPLTNYGYGMEKEAARAIGLSGRWVPAKLNGVPVSSIKTQPINFMLEEDGIDILSKFKYTLYAGIDNELEVAVRKVKSKNITLTISRGKIEETGEGKFIAKVEEEAPVTFSIFNKNSGKLIGEILFQVYPQSQMPASAKK